MSTPFKEALLLLEDAEGISLDDICGHLKDGQCVETAALHLQGSLNNKDNEVTLNTRPHLSQEELLNIQKQYGKSRPLSVTPDSSTISLPPHYLEKSLSKLVINNSHDYLNLLLAFPPSYYTLFFKYAQISCTPPLSEELAIVENIERLGGFAAVLVFAITNKNYKLIKLILTSLPIEKRLEALQKTTTTDGYSILDFATTMMPYKFNLILDLLPEEHRLAAIKEKHPTVLYLVDNNPEAFGTTLYLLPEAGTAGRYSQYATSDMETFSRQYRHCCYGSWPSSYYR